VQAFRTFAFLALCATLAACQTGAPVHNAGDSARVELSDVSRLDAPAVVLSECDVTGGGQVPIPFELLYDEAAIDRRRAYAVRARINVDGRLIFTTKTAVPVITRGHPKQIEIVLRPP
jgi:putative lipoprotein